MHTTTSSRADFRDDINALRAVSVVLVVLYHFHVRGFGGGFMGVDVFFVISGFLMTKIIVGGIEAGRFSYLKFLEARVIRIWPALLAMCLILLLLGTVFLPPIDLNNLAEQAQWALVFYSNRFFHDGQGYFTLGIEERWLLHTWSLSVEWQFYMLYPVLLMALSFVYGLAPASVRQRLDRWHVFLAAIVGVLAVSLAWCIYRSQATPASAFFLLPSRAWQMAAGGLVALLAQRGISTFKRGRARAAQWLALFVLVAGELAAAKFNWERHWPGAYAALPVAAAVLYLLADVRDNRFLNAAPVQALGRWSYSIYLWHWPIVIAANVTGWVDSHRLLVQLGGCAAAVLLGAMSFRWVEAPAARLKKSAASPWMPVAPALGAALMAVAAAAGLTATHGWVARTDDRAAYHLAMQDAKKELSFPPACQNWKIPVSQVTVCQLNPGRPPAGMLVYGDSHAQHLFPWFASRVRERVDFLTMNGCPVAPGVGRDEAGYQCGEFAKLAWHIAERGDYRTIVISGRWRSVDPTRGELCYVGLERGAGEACLKDKPARDALQLLEDGIRRLHLAGKRVIVIDENPDSEVSVPEQLARADYWRRENQFNTPYQRVLADNSNIDRFFARLQAEGLLERISLRDAMCSEGECRFYDATTGLPVLKDRDHFTPGWIRTHGDVLAKAFDGPEALARPVVAATQQNVGGS